MATNHGTRALLAAAVLVLATGPVATAETYRVPEDYPTITEALTTAQWGDTILVGPGVYREGLVMKDGVVLKSVAGPAETSIAYGDFANQNEAVITMQRCSNSTQLIGFAIDGRGIAKRGILVIAGSEPVLEDLVVDGATYGIAVHRAAAPFIQNTTVQNTETAGLFIQAGSADVRDCSFIASTKFGVYIRGSSKAIRFRNCFIEGNTQAGLQATEGDFAMYGGGVTGNGDTGLILQEVSPTVSGVEVGENSNIGIVLENSSAVIRSCRIYQNMFGAVVSGEGAPRFSRNTFTDNEAYHLGVEGDAAPIVGGSMETSNQFIGEATFSLQTSSTAQIQATHNYWGKPCVPKDLFKITSGSVKRKPWVSADLEKEFSDCPAAREYNKALKKAAKKAAKAAAAGETAAATTPAPATPAPAKPAAAEPAAPAEETPATPETPPAESAPAEGAGTR